MDLNLYNHKPTQNTYRSLNSEVVNLFGIPIYYMPKTVNDSGVKFSKTPYGESGFGNIVDLRSNTGLNQIFGEDVNISYNYAIPMKMILENFQEYGGSIQIFDKFGYNSNPEIVLQAEIETWRNILNKYGFTMEKPMEGDLISFDLATAKNGKPQIFEIKSCKELQTYFQFGALYVFRIVCQLWEYSHEKIKTGDPVIDQLNIDISNDIDNIGDNKIIEDKAKKVVTWNPKDPFRDNF
jgi:hypothetical protein